MYPQGAGPALWPPQRRVDRPPPRPCPARAGRRRLAQLPRRRQAGRQRSDESSWRLYIQPAFGDRPVASITKAAIANGLGTLVTAGSSASSVNRYLATLRSLLGFAVADGRISTNPAESLKPPSGVYARREGQFLTLEELRALTAACGAPYGDLVLFLGLSGLH